ncbi:MAG: methyltransferase domain-containing protein [Pseudomonadota bacterium]|nr:methyltransferase domain-containing protein [Pseudomonadota bacterium]
MDEQTLAASWERNAGGWTAAVRSGAIVSRREVTDAAIVAAVRRTGARSVLDLGCGEGWLVRTLAAEGCRVVGVDGAAALIAAARQAGGGTFHHRDYAAIAAAPTALGGPFEAIVCNFSLLGEALPALLCSLRRLAAPRGRLLIQTLHPLHLAGPYRDGWRTEAFQGLDGAMPAPMPWYFRTLGGWVNLLVRAGWTLQALEEPRAAPSAAPASVLFVAVPANAG